ncbi:hypothetical protein ACFOVU_11485 [Nocardiopsis sediminis]|uniref:Amidohydrolase n=1 Tax=Nocardiopsis sediminis TaxID=1778267 RepID=A0ABV8FPD4_9ACTN
MSAVISPDAHGGTLPDEDIAVVRGLELDVDTFTPAAEFERRLEPLRIVGPHLPKHMSRRE